MQALIIRLLHLITSVEQRALVRTKIVYRSPGMESNLLYQMQLVAGY